MIQEYCAGIIPVQKQSGSLKVLLVCHAKGSYWGFPKGHIEKFEESKLSAKRELKEECNLEVVEFLSEEPIEESYKFYRDKNFIKKDIVYFMALVKGSVQLNQPEEIIDYRWVSISEAKSLATFDCSKKVVESVERSFKK